MTRKSPMSLTGTDQRQPLNPQSSKKREICMVFLQKEKQIDRIIIMEETGRREKGVCKIKDITRFFLFSLFFFKARDMDG